jgi:site-specific DNA-cytosine methylase
VDISGSSCNNWSTRGTRTGRNGVFSKFFLTWAKLHLTKQTPLIIHENVRTFDESVLTEVFGDTYIIVPLRLSPATTGFTVLDRHRLYHILIHKTRARQVGDTAALFATLTDVLARRASLRFEDLYLEHTPDELLFEMRRWGNARSQVIQSGDDLTPHLSDWTLLLSDWERKNLNLYEVQWERDFGKPAASDPTALFVLSQNADGFATRTTAQGRVPCLTHGSSTRVWSSFNRRWLTVKEKTNMMGFPVVPAFAARAGVSLLDPSLLTDGHRQIGNAMHLANVGVVLCAALATISTTASAASVPDTPAVGSLAGNLPPGVFLEKRAKRYVVKLDDVDAPCATLQFSAWGSPDAACIAASQYAKDALAAASLAQGLTRTALLEKLRWDHQGQQGYAGARVRDASAPSACAPTGSPQGQGDIALQEAVRGGLAGGRLQCCRRITARR